jgi:flagellar hook-associated protein 3 FlgL
MIFDASTAAMLDQQAALLRTQQQLSTGRRMLAPSDDPIAASQALAVRTAESRAEQYAENQGTARDALAMAESKMASIGDLLIAARTLLVSAGNATQSNSDRAAIATELRGMYAELLGLANARDGQGRYLFAGYQDGSAPFSQSVAGVSYNGDQGRRTVAVAGSREIPTSDNGHSIFELGRSGNGVFKTAANAANTGAGMVSVGRVYDATLLTGHAYRIDFSTGASPAYSVVDVTAATTLSTGNAWNSGAAIRFDGIEVSIENSPGNSDSFNITPSTPQSLFKTLSDAIDGVSSPVSTSADAARFNSLLGTALTELDSGTERVLMARTELGAHLGELDGLASANEAERVLLAGQRSRLEDLDYAQAMSDFARQQMALEAAQRTHVKVTGMTLFNFLP